MIRYDNRVVIVTGAGNGIGRAHAEVFSERGATVLVNDVDRDAADTVVEAIHRKGGRASGNYVSVVNGGEEIIARALSTFGRVDVLINNAGVGVVPIEGGVPIGEMSDSEWHRLLDIHLNGTFSCSRAACIRAHWERTPFCRADHADSGTILSS